MPRSTLSPQQIIQEAYDEASQALRVSGLSGTYVAKSLYDANSILAANSDDTPVSVSVGLGSILGRPQTSGNIKALSGAQLLAILQTSLDPVYTRMVAHGEAEVAFSNDATEKDYISYTIPAGSLAAGDRLRLRASGDMINNTGSGVNYTPKIIVGTTAVLTGTTGSFASSAQRRKWTLDVIVTCVSSSSQKVSASLHVSTATADTWGTTPGVTTNYWPAGQNSSTEDTSSAKALKFSMTMGTADANADFRLQSYFIQKIPVLG